MDNIVVADKQSAVATQNAFGNITLNGPGVVQMPVAPDQVATVTQRGQDLIVTLKSGEKVTIGNFFAVDQAGVGSDIVFVGEDGTLWHAQYDAAAFTGFTFEDVASLDELVAGIGSAGSAMPTWAIAGLSLLGVGGAAAAADHSGGGSSSGSEPGDTTPPATPIDLLVSPNGLRLTGRGEAGSTVNIRDAAGNLIGSGTVAADGSFDVALNPPQINSENLDVTLTDGAGNVSAPGTVTAPDATAPLAPTELAIDGQGSTLTGRAEPGSTVSVRGAGGVLLGTAVAGADGQFSIALQPPQTDGQALEVSAADAAGNTSPAAGITAPDVDTPDTTAPDQPTDLALASGVTLTGRGERGATVQVRDAAGNIIGTGLVNADGTFSLTLAPAQANGEALDIRQVDAAGNSSIPLEFTAPDITPPEAVTDILVGAGGTALSGRGEPGATVEVRDADGNLLGRGVVSANGTFLLELDVQAGEHLSLVQTDPSGNASVAVEYDVPLTSAPDSPSNLAIDADGTTLTGTAPAGSRVEVHDANGTLIGSAVANADGSFTIELNPAQANGELLDVVAIDDSGLSSLPAQVTAPDITAPAAPTELAVSADGTVLTGRAEPGSTVRIVAADGTEIGTAVVGATGVFSITLNPPQVDGEVLQATASDAAGNTSEASSVTAPDIDGGDTTPPEAPVDLVIGLAGSQLSGRGEAGSTVQVHDAEGNIIATGTVGADGTFIIALAPAVIDGSALQVTLTDAAGNVSQPGSVTSADLLPPAQPTELALADGVTFTGRGEPGATVQVRDAAGTLIGTGVVGADGLFSLTLSPAQANGEALDVRLVDAAGNTSAPLQFDAPDITPPEAVSNIVVGAGGLALSGRGEPGATVEVRDASGSVIGTGVVGANGTFLIDLEPAAQPGDQLSLVQTDPSGNASVAVEYDVPLTTAPDSPSNLAIDADGTTLTGSAPAGTRVEVHDANGTLIGSAIANADGSFSIELNPAQANGELLDVVAIDDSGLSSLPAQVTAPDITAPAAPTELAVSADGTVLTGRAEPGSTVRIVAADGTEIGTAVVGATGVFSITLDSPRVDGEVLQATASDAAGNTSEASSVTAPDIDGGDTTPPEAPVDLVIGLAGSQLSGRGEAGSTVQVHDAEGNTIATGTVGADGTFIIALAPAVIDGSALQVTLTDAAGNVSQPGSVTSADLLPPAQPTELALADGVTFTGRGEPGATVQVRDAAGTLIGTGGVGADGLFSLTLSPAQANGEAVDVRLVDAAGNTSAPLQFEAPDITPPEAVSNIVVGAAGLALSGRGEPGATVEVRDASGSVIGTGVVGANGTFLIDLDPAAQPGDQLSLVQTDPSGNASVAVEYDVPLTTAPDSPSNLAIDADGTTLTGSAPAGTRVEVHDANGTLIGSAIANADGSFTIELNPAQANGELLDVVAIDDSGLSSLPAQVTAPDITAPAAPTELAVSADGTVLTGRAEPGSTVRIVAADGTELGTAVVGATGVFSITLDPPQVDGEVLQATASDAAGNTSEASSVTAPDIDGGDTTPPEAPVDLVIGLAGSQLSGRGEVGSTVQVRDAEGNVLATGTVGADGTFVLTLDPAVVDGSTLQVTLTDAAGNVSQPGSVTSADLLPPAQPTELALADGVTFTGRGEPGATVQVRDAAGTLIGTGVVGADGLFNVTLAPVQANGEALDVRLVDAAGNTSAPLQFDAPDITPPEAVSNIVVGAGGLALSGRGEPGATVEVRDASGTVIGTGVVGANGTFLIDLEPAAQPGDQLSLVQTDPSGNASVAVEYDVPLTTAPDSPSNLAIDADGTTLTGTAPAGSRVEVHDANGTLIGSAVANADGSFTIELNPAQANGELLDVVAIDDSGLSSLPAQVTAPDITAPAAPTELAVSADGTVLTGRAEPGSTVRIVAADGTEIGTAVVGATGVFSITLNPPQVDGEVLQATASDAAGNTSEASSVTAPDIDGGDTTPPEAPVDLVIGLAGSQLSGRGEVGTTVQVRDAEGNVLATGTVGADGTFIIALAPAVIDGSTLQVTLTDAAGNISQPGSVTSADLLPPAQPTELALADGVTFTGSGEPGATVQVRDAAGTIIGSGVVNEDGTFSLNLSPAQANGEALDVRLVDAAGNTSAPLQYNAPDITPPNAVSDILVGQGGTALSGRGEAGATVEVRDTDGNLLGRGVVTANGTFLISLDPVAQPGEQLSLVQVDPSGNASLAFEYEVPLTTAPVSPSGLVIDADGTTLNGTAPAGSRVEVHDAGGALIGTATANADGSFSIELNPAQANGELLNVVAIDVDDVSSLPTQINAPDITAPAAPSDLAVSADGSVITGRAEPGSTLRVVAADGTELGTVVVGPTGVFSIALEPAQVDGEVLQATATDAAGNTSATSAVTAPDIDGVDITPPAAPTDLVVGLAGSQLAGRGEPGATVQVVDAAGNVLATGTVAADGSFTITLDPAVNDGSALQVTLADAAGNVSPPASVNSPDLQAPAQPIELALINGVTFTGRGEPGATVQVRDAAGTVIGTGLVGADGLFSLSLSPAQANGEALDVRLVDAAGNTSAPLQFDAPDITPPEAVSDIIVGAGGLALSGRGEPGATVEVRDASGSVIGTGVVAANGTFLVDLDPAVQPGEQLSLVQSDPSGNASQALQFEVPATTAPASPSDLVFAEDGSSISGTAPAGTRVEVHDANGTLLGSVVAGADGSFTVALDPIQANGELLDVVAIDDAGVSSLPTSISAPDITAPVAPSELLINGDGTVVTGRAEAGSTVRVLAADGTTVLGTVVVGATGSFSITLDPPRVNGEQLQVTATDVAGNASTAGNVTAPDIDGGDTTPPEAPTNLVIGLAGGQLNGRGEAGASVEVRDAQGNVLANGTVTPDGTFQLTLDPPVNDGSSLQVVLTDAAGNESEPGTVNTPDLQAPAQPTELALVDGVTFSGRGEPGATVQVRDAAGTVIGTGLVNEDGTFSLTLFPAQANGEALEVRLSDAAGNNSEPLQFDAPDITPPAAVSNIVVGADGLVLSGRGEAGATVEVRDADGTVIGTATVGENGTFIADLDPAAQPGAQLSLVQTDAAGNASEALAFEVPLTTAPTSPSELVVAEDGTSISGSAPVGSRVEVHDADGTLVGSIVVGAEGTFTVILNPAQANGELLDVVAIDASGASSLPVQVSAPDITAPVAPSELLINGDGTVVTGRAEAGSTVRVLAADGTTVLGTVVVGDTGSFSITLDPPQVNGEQLQVTSTDVAGNASTAGNVTAPDIDGGDTTPPEAPTNLVIGLAGGQLNGRGEAGASVEVRDAQGNVLANGTVNPDGTFQLTLDPPVNDGSSLQVVLTDAAGNESEPGTVNTPDLQAPAQPTELALVEGVTFSGRGEPGATVQVRDAAGTVIGTGLVNEDGTFSLTLFPAQANGEALEVRLSDAAGNNSEPLQFDAPDITPPAAVSNIVVGADGLVLSGRGEAGATVEVRDADGTVIGTATVGENGTFIADLDPAAQPGAQLSLVQTDAAGNASEALAFEVPLTTAPTSPSELVVAEDGTSISGSAPVGSRVEVHDADGTLVGSIVVGAEGTFTVILNPAQANGELLDVVAIDASGASSLPVQVSAPDITAPVAPSELLINGDGTVVTGRAEAGSTVRVLAADGTTVLGTVVVGATGSFSITLDPPQVNGEQLQVTATDVVGNASTAGNVTAPDIDGGDTTPPEAPTNLVIGLAGGQLNGRGEAGASVEVRDAQGNVLANGTVNPDGTFQLTLDPPVNDGSSLQVVLTDAAGNESEPGTVNTPDLQAPAQPSGLELVDGVTLTGSGEPGATVQVRDATGDVIGTGLVNEDGSFSVTLSPAQANGEVLDIRLVDAAGNTSTPLQFDAPDITPPAVVSNIVVGADGLTLSGRGESGATVEVRDANGALIGTGTVTANGTFLLDLDPAALPGERLSLVQTDASGNASTALDYDVPLVTTPASPSELVVAEDGTSISGSAPVGSRVEVHDADGTLVGSIVVGAEGTFTVVLDPAQANGELLDVVAIDNNGTSSLPVQVSAPDITAPLEPSDLVVNPTGTVVTGRAEVGSTVRVLAADGTTELGSVVVGATGAFEITLSPAQVAGEQLQVTATDAAGNASLAGTVTAPIVDNGGDITPPEPASNLAISDDGLTVSGRGEVGATVEVRNDQGELLISGTVQPDGSFTVQLPDPVVDGSSLQVTLTDGAGNVSTPAPLLTPDNVAPLQPAGLVLTEGETLVGSAEPGARVEVHDADGNLIGNTIAELDGSFTLTLDPPQANGETVTVTVIDAAGNTSVPLSYVTPDITPPDIITNVAAGAGGLAVSGRGEAGASVEVRDADGNLIGTGTVAANGTFVVDLDTPLAAGETIVLVQIDAAGNPSVGLGVIVADAPVPESPSDVVVAGDGSAVSGTAPAGSLVEVRDAQGNVVGSVQVGQDGSFTIDLTPVQANGEALDVVAIDADGNSSLPTQVSAPDITPPNEATELQLSNDGSTLTGRGEPGTTVQVIDAQGNVLGNAQVGADGVISVQLAPAQTDGQELDVVLRDNAGNTSTATINAPDLDGPLQPSGLAIDTAGIHLTGEGQSGSTITVRDADGNVLGTATVGADGRFDVTLNTAQRNGESLTVDATDNLGNSAGPVDFTAPDTTPPQVVTTPAIDDTGTTVTGNGEPGATVTVRGPDGSALGSVVIDADGAFEITLDPPQTNGQALTVEQRDPTGNLSAAVDLAAPDSEAPAIPGALSLSSDGTTLTGTGEPGAQVTVTGTGGAVVGTATVQADGSFSVAINPAQVNGQTLTVTQADSAGNPSPADTVTAPDLEAPLPAQGLGLNEEGTLLSGQGEAGSTVEVRNSAGDLLGTVVVDGDGTFQVPIAPPQTNGETVSVVLIDEGGNASPSTSFTADDNTAPTAPAGLTITAGGNAIQGTGEAGSTVEVRNVAGDLLGSVVVPAGGNFTVPLAPAQLDGQVLEVTLTDAAGNVSDSTPVTAPDITPPALPTEVAVSDDGTTVTGSAPGASTVTVTDSAGNVVTVPVDPDGSFSVPLTDPLTNGETLTVVVTDAAGNDSAPITTTAPDTTDPLPATGIIVSPDGTTVGGSAEPGSTVEVRDADGNPVGSGTAGPDGTFVVPVDPPLAAGDNGTVVVIDRAGNISTEVPVAGPTGTEAATPTGLSISADGFLLTGQGTVGSLITVTSGGTTLGTATVGSDGTFRVFFQNAQLNAQTLQVSARTTVDGEPSVPATLVANDTTAPNAPTAAIDRTGSTLTGQGEVGATVRVTDTQGTVLGTATVGSNGLYTVTLTPAVANGQNLIVTQADAAGNVSLAASLQAPDLQAPLAASNLSLNGAATVLSGQGEAGASVTVRDASGAILATGTVNQSGQFQVTLPSAQTTGSPLQVTLSDAAGNVSGPASLATPDRTPPAAIGNPALSQDGRQLSGSGEVGATVQVRNAAGTVLGTATVGADGRFTVTFDTPQTNGQAIGVTQVDAAGNTSPAVNVATPDLTPPAALTNVALNNNGLTLTGLGEAGATVSVRGPDGTIIGTGLVAANGSFTLTLTSAQLNAQQLSVTQTDAGNNTSSAVAVTAPDFTPPATPTALALAATGLQLTGNAEAGSTVTVRDASGNVLGTAVAGSNGTFQVTLNSAQTNGQALQVTATDAAGNVSPAAPYAAADTTPPAAVSNLAVSADGATLAGNGEAGATVTVRAADGTALGTATVATDGHFSVSLSPAAITGESLSVVQADAAQNVSPEQNVTAPGVLVPDTPDNLVLAADGLSVTGTAPAGTTVNVYGPNGVLLGTSPVANDGTFTVNLGSAQANGELLQVSATGTDGAVSLPASLQAPDTTAPQPLTNLVLSNDGLVLSGRGEPGATVTVTGEGGVDLGTALVDANGNFSADLSGAQINGEQISAVQWDAAGNESNSVSLIAPDRVAPDAAENLAFAGGGSLLNGTGEAGAAVKVLASDGSVLGTATVRADGSFQVNLDSPQANGQQVNVVLTDAAGNQSDSSAVTAPDTTPPAAPGELAISGDGVTLTGRGEAGALVTVTNPAGDEIGSAVVDASGYFTITLNPALGNAELLSFTQADGAGNVSAVATLLTPDFTPPAALTQVGVNTDGSVVTGLGEPGATVTVNNAAGALLGTGTVLADGSFRVELSPPQINDEVLSVQQADPPGNVSEPVEVRAPDLTPPVPATELQLNAAGDVLTGVGEAGATVQVFVGTAQIGTTTVAANGTFTVNLDDAQLNGQVLQVTLTDGTGNISPISTVSAADITPPDTVVAVINNSGTQLVGTAEAGTRVTVINNNGDLLGQVTVDPDGTFVIDLTTAQINGQQLTLIAQDATGNPSAPLVVTAPDLTPPVQPSDLLLNPAGTSMTGTAEAGSTITVRGPNNNVVGEVVVGDNGQFTVPISPAQNNGQLLSVVSTDAAGNASLPAAYQTNDTSPPALVTDLGINNTFNILTGKGEAGATVTVSRGGAVLGTGEVDAAGNFQITLVPAAGSLATLAVTQSDGFNTSAVATYVTPLIAPPVPPSNVTLGSDGLTLSGSAPSGTGIRVYDAGGNLIGTGGATLNGTFELQLSAPLLNGQHISVTAVALVGGESQPTFVQATDVTPPANPVVTALSSNGLVLTGSGEAGATVTVRDATGNVIGSGVVNAGGAFSITLDSAQLNGQELGVSQADVAGNNSGSTRFTAIDVQPPAAPTNVQINGTGTVLTGRGEAGATVTVQGPNGQVGTGVVQADGSFTITLTTAQNDGQLLVVRQADAAGNLSGSVNLPAPDTTPPAAPVAAINNNGTSVTGTGQVGSTVTVRNSAGTVLGTATVASNGTFVVSLTAAQIDNQALSVTLTDSAGNVSTGTALTAPDLTPPAAAGNLLISADGATLTGTGEVGATVTVRSANGTVLQTATVRPDGGFTVTLAPPQDNGQILSVTVSDPRGNVSGNVNITAPDVDANAPVIASDNLATATVDLVPVSATKTYTDSFLTVLSGFTKTFTWTVEPGTTVDPILTLTTNSVLALLNNASFTLQVKDASGAWVTLATGNTQGLLDLIVLPIGLQVDIGKLQAGDYRLTVGSGGIGVATQVTTTLDITATSLTQFTGTGTATTGNVITDVGTDGSVDARGPDSAAVLQVLKDGSYVTADTATTVQGLYGTLVIRADGSYTYTPNGSPASVGKVDVFSYQLAHPNGVTDAANLYVRIDSPQATEIWSDTNYAAPATVVDAVNDVGFSDLTLANRVDTSSATLGVLNLPVIGSRQATYTATVAADTTANLQVVVNSSNLLSLLNGTTIELLKLNPATGQYVLVQTVNGGSLISLLGGGAGYTFQNQGAGTYHVRVTAGGIGLLSSITTSLNATTTHLTEFVVSGATAATGNLLTDDNVGSALTVLSVLTAANTYTIPGYNGVSVAGTYGTLLVHADGSYTYTLNSGLTSAAVGQHDTFTYELTHPNGSTDTATLTVNLDNAAGLVTTTSLLSESGDETVALASLAATTDVIAGTDGNDHLDGSQGGHITLQGGAGNDTLVVVDQNFASVEGGSGTDTLLWGGGDASIDLGNVAGRVHDIEIIDLNDTSSVALTLNLADVVAITETGTDTLIIKGDDKDSVHMTDNWTLVGYQTADGVDYNQYTAQEDPSHHLWVQNGIHVV